MSNNYANNGGLNSASGEFNPNSFSGKPQFFNSKKQNNMTDDSGFKIERNKPEGSTVAST